MIIKKDIDQLECALMINFSSTIASKNIDWEGFLSQKSKKKWEFLTRWEK